MLRVAWMLLWLIDFRTRALRHRWARWQVAVPIACWANEHRLYRLERLVFQWFALKLVVRDRLWRFEDWFTEATMHLRPRCAVCGQPEFALGCPRCFAAFTSSQLRLRALSAGRSRTAPGSTDA